MQPATNGNIKPHMCVAGLQEYENVPCFFLNCYFLKLKKTFEGQHHLKITGTSFVLNETWDKIVV